jgi:hypothetical protein
MPIQSRRPTISDSRDEATDDQLRGSICSSLNDSAHHHDAIPIHDRRAPTELVTPDCGHYAANKAADIVECNLPNF